MVEKAELRTALLLSEREPFQILQSKRIGDRRAQRCTACSRWDEINRRHYEG